MPKPHTLSHAEAAAVPLAALSAWQGLFDHGSLTEGERVLIHGATGGVGQFATQLASRQGAHVIATTSTAGIARAREFGADVVIDHTAGPWDADVEPVDLADRLAVRSGQPVAAARASASFGYHPIVPSGPLKGPTRSPVIHPP